MPKQILFIQGAGAGTYEEWDKRLVQSLERKLGHGYSIRYPRMPDEDNPQYSAWKAVLVNEINELAEGAILIGHSVGGTMLIHTLTEKPANKGIGAILLLAAPFVGEGGWPSDEMNPQPNFAECLPADVPVLLYHGTADEIVPVAHMQFYAGAIPQAKTRKLSGRDHQFDNDVSDITRDIRSFAV